MTSPLARWWRGVRGRRGPQGSRGAAELSVVLVTGSLVAGVFFGQGLSQTAVDITNGLTWLTDDPSGEIIQVNPATGELQMRQLVGAPGDDLGIFQRDGKTFVINNTTGQLMSLDLASILISGQRRVATDGAVDLLIGDDHVFLVDTDTSTIAAIDPVRTDPIGTIWVAPTGLADAAIDAQGDVWALEDSGTLHRMTWSDDLTAFTDDDTTTIDYSGPGSILIAHDTGVSILGPDQGIVAQVGTEHDFADDAPTISGDLLAPETSPDTLVPVTAPQTSTLHILTPGTLTDIDLATIDCTDPATPEVFNNTIYVPCHGQGRVLQLDAAGNRTAPDITTPGTRNPELVLDQDTLIINTPGAPQGLVINPDGTPTPLTRYDDTVPVTTPGTTDAPPPPPPRKDPIDELLTPPEEPDEPETPPSPGPGIPIPPIEVPTLPVPTLPVPTDGSPVAPTAPAGCDGSERKAPKPCQGADDPSPPETSDPSGGGEAISAPTQVTARTLGEGQVEVTWSHSGIPKPEGFAIRTTDGTEVARVKSFVRQAVITIEPGVATSFTVSAVFAEQEATSPASAPVTATARPGAPTVQGAASYEGDGRTERFVVVISWNEAAANGAAVTGYDVSVTTPDGSRSQSLDPAARSATFEWTCDQVATPACTVGGNYQATVVARNERGAGQPGALAATAPTQPPPPLPAQGARIVASSSPRTVQVGDQGQGQIVLTLAPPADWSRFPGTCTYVLDQSGAVTLPCDARSVTVPLANGPIYEPDSGRVNHVIGFRAQNARGTASSIDYKFTSEQTALVLPPDPGTGGCPNPSPTTCQIP